MESWIRNLWVLPESGARVYTHHELPSEEMKKDYNLDIWVEFPPGETWVGTIYTCGNVQSLMDKFRRTGEKGQLYHYDTSSIVVEEISITSIPLIIEELIRDDGLRFAFERSCDLNDNEE